MADCHSRFCDEEAFWKHWYTISARRLNAGGPFQTSSVSPNFPKGEVFFSFTTLAELAYSA